MARKKVKSATDQRSFTLVYNDFLESNLLGKHEKLIFIAIKKFADNDTLKAFPSLKTLNQITGISIRWIKKSIEHMEKLGVISVERRENDEKGHQSNLYTLYDFAEVWKAKSSAEIDDVKKNKFVNLQEVPTELLLRELERREKEKEPETTEPTKDQLNQAQIQNYQNDMVNVTTNSLKSQESERYSLEQIRVLYDYEIMIHDKPYQKDDIDSVMSILHTNLNTTKTTIRIGGEDKPSMVVIGKLMKLTCSGIMYAIEKFTEQTERIKNPIAYMLTLLYSAEEQMNLDISNRVQYDMYHQKAPTEEK